ncbi:MAG: hypothetical protein GX589_05045 [Deltaproteobacteria bacterium]|nr:hypothetical protein [Deltaproteobacteria bacterium]
MRWGANASQGFTVIEMVTVLGVSALIFAGIMIQYSDSVSASYNQKVRMAANLQAQAILQNIVLELRVLGNGVPFDQTNFQIDEQDGVLTDPKKAWPIDIDTATAHRISFRLNETGTTHLLYDNFNPSASLQIRLTDTEGLDVNDPIYITNSVVAGDDGFYGVLTAVNHSSKTVTVGSDYVVSRTLNPDTETWVDAVFPEGSLLEEVPMVTFDSPADNSGITRDSGYGAVMLGAGSTMTLEYLDQNGATIGLPLTLQKLAGQLRLIRVTVTMPSSKKFSDGSIYTATASQTVGLRNLNYTF